MPGPGGVCTWSGVVYLVGGGGGVPGPGGVSGLGGGVPGLEGGGVPGLGGGVSGLEGWCAWSQRGGVPGLGGSWCLWSGGMVCLVWGVPGPGCVPGLGGWSDLPL